MPTFISGATYHGNPADNPNYASQTTDLGRAGAWAGGAVGNARAVTQNPIFKTIFDPLGVTDAGLSPLSPDSVNPNAVNYKDFEDKASSDKLNQLQEFYKHLNGPLDMNDPEVRMITQNATNVGMRQASNQGVRGGLAVGNTQRNVANAQTGLSGQRQQMYAQGMTQLAGLQQQASNAQYGRYKDALDTENAQTEALRQQVQKKNQGILGLAGGIIGGIFGKPEVGQAIGNAGGAQSVTNSQFAGTSY